MSYFSNLKVNLILKHIFFWNFFNGIIRRSDLAFWIAVIAWVVEWLLVVEYLMGEYWRTYIVFPIRIPLILLLLMFYWFYLWGMSGWRRAQFGRFTRGDRKLWAKGYTAFWVAELVTIGSFVLIYFWLSWGPLPLVRRFIMFPRKGLYLELIFYSYLIFLAYIIKLSTKWCLWTYQYFLTLILLMIFIILLWRDVSMLLTRETFINGYGTHWPNIKLTALIYSLSNEWWIIHMFGQRNIHTYYYNLDHLLILKERPFSSVPAVSNYMLNHHLLRYSANYNNNIDWALNTNKLYLDPLLNLQQNYSFLYPRRLGFTPKRLAMWQLLIILKMWHHLFILLWWSLYLFRLRARQKTTYSFLAVCYFNIYCCYILGLVIYAIYFAAFWELYLKIRPTNFSVHRFGLLADRSLDYIFRGFIYGRSGTSINELLISIQRL